MKQLGVGLIFCVSLLAGCSMNRPINHRELVHMKSNTLSNEAYLADFLDKLYALETNGEHEMLQLRVLHIGDSHIQMGYLSNSIREGMQAEFGGSELGYFFPYKLTGGYNPAGISLSTNSEWKSATNSKPDSTIVVGITGATAVTVDSISNIDFAFKGREKIKTVSIYHQPLGNKFEIRCEGAQIVTSETENNTAYTAITLPAEESEMKVEIVKVKAGDHHLSIYGVSMNQLITKGIDYNTFGVSGNQYQFFKEINPLFKAQLKDFQPDLMIISLGSNDAYRKDLDSLEYQEMVVQFVKTLREISPKTDFILTSPPDTKYKNERPSSENTILNSIRQASILMHTAEWDFNTIMGGKESNPKWQKMNLANKDGLHLTEGGYEVQGALFNVALAKALKNKYPKSAWLTKTKEEYQNEILKVRGF